MNGGWRRGDVQRKSNDKRDPRRKRKLDQVRAGGQTGPVGNERKWMGRVQCAALALRVMSHPSPTGPLARFETETSRIYAARVAPAPSTTPPRPNAIAASIAPRLTGAEREPAPKPPPPPKGTYDVVGTPLPVPPPVKLAPLGYKQ